MSRRIQKRNINQPIGYHSVAWLHISNWMITINLRDIYTAPCIMILRQEMDITRGIGIVVLKVEPVLGPGIARA